MRIQVTDNTKLAETIRTKLKEKGNHCPCSVLQDETTLCPCKDFRENAKEGDYCHCGLWKKIEY